MTSPIRRLIDLNPTPAIIVTQAPMGYDPSADEDYVPGAGIQTWIIGSYSNVRNDGESFAATFTVEMLPPYVSSTDSRVRMADGDYGIAKIRTRRRFGQVSGYTLELTE